MRIKYSFPSGFWMITVLSFLLFPPAFAQKKASSSKQYYTACIAFYNVENLFDTLDAPDKNDEDFLPEGSYKWNSERYYKKLENISSVLSQLGGDISPEGPAIIGLAEIENRLVLEDLVKTEKLAKSNYGIVHYESPDKRGVDVGLLYNPKYFNVKSSASYTLTIQGKDDFFTRDQLLVSGTMDGEMMHFIVLHWPSRRGGEKQSRPLRNAAADLSRHIIDSLLAADPKSKIVLMGDLNDDPVDESVKKHLNTVATKEAMNEKVLFNPMASLFEKGIGTLAWNDAWNLFDQIILSQSLLDENSKSFHFKGAKVFNKEFLKQESGNFKGYPFRTYVGSNYMGGYSDHFPVYIILAKEVH